jgi:hypothetical protein
MRHPFFLKPFFNILRPYPTAFVSVEWGKDSEADVQNAFEASAQAIAVTKGFKGSPHVDTYDIDYQQVPRTHTALLTQLRSHC